MGHSRIRRRIWQAAVALVLLAACDGGGSARPLYVAVGASDSVGVGADDPESEAWPVVFHRQALGDGVRFRNVATSGATVASALERQLPAAVEARPQVVTVWLAVNDLLARVPPAAYEERLGRLVGPLRETGATVLVGNVPALPWLGDVGPYNDAVARVVAAEGAVLVDLHARSAAFDPSMLAADLFHPSTAGHRALADAFADAYRARSRSARKASLAS